MGSAAKYNAQTLKLNLTSGFCRSLSVPWQAMESFPWKRFSAGLRARGEVKHG